MATATTPRKTSRPTARPPTTILLVRHGQTPSTGKILPGEGDASPDPDYPGTAVSIPVSAPGRTGHHVVFMIWQASHKDQSFYSCSDVNFTG